MLRGSRLVGTARRSFRRGVVRANRWRPNFRAQGIGSLSSCARWWAKPPTRKSGCGPPKDRRGVRSVRQRAWDKQVNVTHVIWPSVSFSRIVFATWRGVVPRVGVVITVRLHSAVHPAPSARKGRRDLRFSTPTCQPEDRSVMKQSRERSPAPTGTMLRRPTGDNRRAVSGEHSAGHSPPAVAGQTSHERPHRRTAGLRRHGTLPYR